MGPPVLVLVVLHHLVHFLIKRILREKNSPEQGFKPGTSRSTVWQSTNWAKETLLIKCLKIIYLFQKSHRRPWTSIGQHLFSHRALNTERNMAWTWSRPAARFYNAMKCTQNVCLRKFFPEIKVVFLALWISKSLWLEWSDTWLSCEGTPFWIPTRQNFFHFTFNLGNEEKSEEQEQPTSTRTHA